ncbi:MAG: ABC transporter permease [Ectothiorhodospiraceae bacterium]|nr:ABC transporter permease [Chromatiales bacterium]MCP5154093.1 ABC transporter permease [Ectothiorhodospiraceae bacterium]
MSAAEGHRDWRDVVYPLALIGALLAGWEWAATHGYLRPIRFPPPSTLLASLVELVREGFPEGITLGTHFALTMQRILAGFALAVALAVPLGLAIGWYPLLDRLTESVIAFCRSVATLSLLPLAIVWFGTGEGSKVFLIGYGCFWVMLANTVAAVRQVDPLLVRAASTMDTGPAEMFVRVVLPAVLPRLFAGARIALGVGFMVIVGAEMIGTIHGLGALIMEARTFYRSDITVVGMIVIGGLGFAITAAMQRLERLLLPWQAPVDGAR